MLQVGKSEKTNRKNRCSHIEIFPRILYKENNVKNYFCKMCFDSKYLPKECVHCKGVREIKDFPIVIKNTDLSKGYYCDLKCYSKFNGKEVLTPLENKLAGENKPKEITPQKEGTFTNFSDFQSKLTIACDDGNLKNVKEIIEGCSKVFLKDYLPKCHDLLTIVCKKGHIHVLKYLISQGLNLEKNYPLNIASAHGKTIIVQYLVENWANVFTDLDSATIYACENGHVETAKYLFSKGNNLNARNNNNQGFIFACRNGHLPMVQYLLIGRTIPQDILKEGLEAAYKNGYIEIVDFLNEIIGDPSENKQEILDKQFVYAIKNEDLFKMKDLVNHGIDLHYKDDYYMILACESGKIDTIQYLESFQVNIRTQDDSPLIAACTQGHLEIVKYLISKGADPKAQNNKAFSEANVNWHIDILKYLYSITASKNFHVLTTKHFIFKNGCLFISENCKISCPMLVYTFTISGENDIPIFEQLSRETGINIGIYQHVSSVYHDLIASTSTVKFYENPDKYYFYCDEIKVESLKKFISEKIRDITPIKMHKDIYELEQTSFYWDNDEFGTNCDDYFNLVYFCDFALLKNYIHIFNELQEIIVKENIPCDLNIFNIDKCDGSLGPDKTEILKNSKGMIILEHDWEKVATYIGNINVQSIKQFILTQIEKIKPPSVSSDISIIPIIDKVNLLIQYHRENGVFPGPYKKLTEKYIPLQKENFIENVKNFIDEINRDGESKIFGENRNEILKRLKENIPELFCLNTGKKGITSPNEFSLKLHEYIFELDPSYFDIDFPIIKLKNDPGNHAKIYLNENECGKSIFPALVFFYNKRDLTNKFTDEQLIILFNTIASKNCDQEKGITIAIFDTDEHRFDHVAFSPLEIMFYHDYKDYREYNKRTVNVQYIERFIEDCFKGNCAEKMYSQYIQNIPSNPEYSILNKRGVHSKIYILEDSNDSNDSNNSLFNIDNFGFPLNRNKQYICPMIVLFYKDTKYIGLFNELAQKIKSDKININLGIFDISKRKYPFISDSHIIHYIEGDKNMGYMKYAGKMEITPLYNFVVEMTKKMDMVVGYTSAGEETIVLTHNIPAHIARKNNELLELKFSDFYMEENDTPCLNMTFITPMIILFCTSPTLITIFKEVANLQRKNYNYPRMGIVRTDAEKTEKELNCTKIIRKSLKNITGIVYHYDHSNSEPYKGEFSVEKINDFINRKMAWETPYKMRKWNDKNNETALKLNNTK
jgi:ankyrin repeat protein